MKILTMNKKCHLDLDGNNAQNVLNQHNNGGKFVMFIHHQLKVDFEFHSSTKNKQNLSISLNTNYFEMLIIVLMIDINDHC